MSNPKLIYLCLCTIAVIFFWHELEQFHSKDSSFKEYEETIQESPAIVFCFDPFKKITNVATNDEDSLALDPYKVKHYGPYKLGIDFNISYSKWGHYDIEIISNLTEGLNHIVDERKSGVRKFPLMLATMKTYYYGYCYRLLTKSVNKGWRIYIAIHFSRYLDVVPTADVYITSFENSYGITRDIWYDGEPLILKKLNKKDTGIKLKVKKRKYLKEVHRCRDAAFYKCFATRFAEADFSNCPKKCSPFSSVIYDLPDCNTKDEMKCAKKIFFPIWRNSTGKDCGKPCSFDEYYLRGMWEEEAKQHRIFLAYEFLKHENIKVYEEFFIYDTVGMMEELWGCSLAFHLAIYFLIYYFTAEN